MPCAFIQMGLRRPAAQEAARRQHRDGARPGLSAGRRRRRRVSLSAFAGSLRLRLLAGTLAWMLFTIALVGWGLRSLFRDHITEQLQAQLVTEHDQLSAAVDWEPGKGLTVAPMA